MKHLKIYEEFSIDNLITNNKETKLDKIKDDILMFKSRKDNLKKLVLSNRNTDKDITKNIQQIVKKNVYLTKYLEIINLSKKIETLKDNIESANNNLKEKQIDLSNVNEIEDKVEKEEQTKKISDAVKKYKENITSYKKAISEIEPQINKLEAALNKEMNLELIRAKKALVDGSNKTK